MYTNKHSNLWRGLLALLFAVWLAASAWAADPFKIKDIRVEGLQSVDPGTVFGSLPFRTGDSYSPEQGTAAIRALFGLGLFQDVNVAVENDVIVINVSERPRVQTISFEGLKEFDKEVVLKMLKDVGVASDLTFDKALVERAEREIKRQYLNRSLYAVEVITTVTPAAKNRVNLHFQVVEGGVAKIKEFRIIGAKAFSEASLRDELALDTGTWLSWYTKSDRYSQAKLNGDLETLRAYYLTRGYLEFRINSTQVAIAPTKDAVSITINVTEGERYTVSGVELSGDYLGRKDAFAAKVTIRPGEPYNVDAVTETAQNFREYFGDFGYAFARIETDPVIARDTKTVRMVLKANPQQRVYVRRIEVGGNQTTRDEVIRREFRQMEAAWYDGQLIRESRNRVDRLGFFKAVAIEHRDVPGSPDQVDLVLTVEEKPTGNLSLGAGYSQSDKLSLTAGITQDNVFGSGNSLSFNIDTSKFNRGFYLSATDPYFTTSGLSRSFDVSYRTTRPYDSQEGDYVLNTLGGSVRLGVPFTASDTVYFGLGVDSTKITTGSQLPNAYQEFVSNFGSPALAVPLSVGWSKDSRDSFLAPSEGRYQRANLVLSAAGDARYLTLGYQFQQYWPLTKKYTFALNTEVNTGQGIGGRSLPVFKYFQGGGLGSVRGFQQGTLGGETCILDATQACPASPSYSKVGGTASAFANFELSAPFPGAGNDRTLRMFGFLDAGTVYCKETATIRCDSNAMRASSGFGISWISPVGPLRLAWAKPIASQPTDLLQNFQFQIGTSF